MISPGPTVKLDVVVISYKAKFSLAPDVVGVYQAHLYSWVSRVVDAKLPVFGSVYLSTTIARLCMTRLHSASTPKQHEFSA